MKTTQIIARDNCKGIAFADGSFMLQRQGCSSTVNGNVHSVFVEVHIADKILCNLTHYPEGRNTKTVSTSVSHRHTDADISLRRQWFAASAPAAKKEPLAVPILPAALLSDISDFIETHTGKSQTKIRTQTHSYMYGNSQYGYQENDIVLSPYRYDQTERAIRRVHDNAIIAVLPAIANEQAGSAFDPDLVKVLASDEEIAGSLTKALSLGFHQCDKKAGSDYCMRRLTWLAGNYYEEANSGRVIKVFVLGPDMERPAELVEPS